MNQYLTYEPNLSWPASLSCEFHKTSTGGTALAEVQHSGPLRVQKLFHDRDLAHCYVLHPPGGMVSGDDLDCRFHVHPDARILLTTPAAGKLYRSRSNGSLQTATTTVKIDDGGICAYLPQDTIVFNGANGKLETNVSLSSSASYFGWEHTIFGRSAGALPFMGGQLSQCLTVSRDHQLLYRDRLQIDAEVLKSGSGLDGMTSLASCLLILPAEAQGSDKLVETCRLSLKEFEGISGVTAIRDGLISIRLLSSRSEDTRTALERLWSPVGEFLMARKVEIPRIWRT